MTHDRRFARQVLLPEVGDTGQARLAGAQVQVPVALDPLASSVATLYLERAGVGTVGRTSLPPPDFPHGDRFCHPATRAVAYGAWFALREIRSALLPE